MKKLTIVLTLLFSHVVHADFENAGYDSNVVGVVTHVLTYSDYDNILIKMTNQPKSHETCTKFDYLVVDGVNKQMILSRLLVAYTTGKPTNIGYDGKGNTCATGSRIRVHRVG